MSNDYYEPWVSDDRLVGVALDLLEQRLDNLSALVGHTDYACRRKLTSNPDMSQNPSPDDTKIIVADGHDVGASHMCAQNLAAGYTDPRFTYWLTPSGKLLEEGKSYRMRWVERFRGVRQNREYTLLRLLGQWEIDSEALG